VIVATASITAVGNQDGVVWSTQVKRCKRRHKGQAQDADTLGPKGTWPGPEAPNSSGAVVEPPAERPLTPLTLSARSLFSASSPICLLQRQALQDNQGVPVPFRRGELSRPWPARSSDAVRQDIAPNCVNPLRVQRRRLVLIDRREIDQRRLRRG